MMQLLFVDDDPELLKIIRDYFQSRGFHAATCENAQQAISYVEKHPVDCVILDIMMPGIDGFELCRWFKTQITAPIIFLTCYTEMEYLYQGFSLGGDDFLTKPCDLRELELRVTTRIKSMAVSKSQATRLEFPPLVIDIGVRQVYIDDTPVALTAYEFEILLLLASSPDHIFSPESIYREVWKLPDLENALTVKVHVARMRHKLDVACPGRTFIGTTWKKGYHFLTNPKKEETT